MNNFETVLTKAPAGDALFDCLKAICKDAMEALGAQKPLDRFASIFWLCGPFILLVERTPADIWLSVLSLLFLAKVVQNRFTLKPAPFWVQAALVFWGWSLFSAILSDWPLYSVLETVAWFRFPLFVMASVCWIGKDKRMVYAMLLSSFVAVMLLCGILFAELMLVGQQNGRLTWPYGNKVPGSYVAKVGLPIFTLLVVFAISLRTKIASICAAFALITLFISFVTGERINFLIRACGGLLAGALWKPNWKRYGFVVMSEVVAVLVLFRLMPETKARFVDNFIAQLPTGQHSGYYRAMAPAVDAWKTSPIFGVGPANYRALCPEMLGDQARKFCQPHPHNYYFQLLAETGAVGLLIGSVFLGSIIWTCFVASRQNKANPFVAVAWVVPFGLFWPTASTADFFGQWHNIFMWTGVAIAMCSINLVNRNKTDRYEPSA